MDTFRCRGLDFIQKSDYLPVFADMETECCGSNDPVAAERDPGGNTNWKQSSKLYKKRDSHQNRSDQ